MLWCMYSNLVYGRTSQTAMSIFDHKMLHHSKYSKPCMKRGTLKHLNEPALRSAEVPQPDRIISPRFRFRRLTSSKVPPDDEVCPCNCATFSIITHFEFVCEWVLDDVSLGTTCSSRAWRPRTHVHIADQRGQGPWTIELSFTALAHLHLWFSS